MKRLGQLIDRYLGWCPIYQAVAGGYRYYRYTQEWRHLPSQLLHFGKNARLGANVTIDAPGRCYVGDNAGIGSGTYINAVGGFHLGNHSGIAGQSMVFTAEHRFIGARAIPFDRVRQVKPVYIEDFVWVGAGAKILPGVRIGEGAIIGSGAVVRNDVPALSIVVGNPAEVIGVRSRTAFEELKRQQCRRNVHDRCLVLWVPPFIRRKYGKELAEFGFETAPGEEYFLDDESHRKLLRIDNAEAIRMSAPTEPCT
jgi:maltose O-acetyltransferase